ncbi:MAG: hypothetical protein WC914_05840 [Proteiniphilum sp.]|jgi:L-serine dehydratase
MVIFVGMRLETKMKDRGHDLPSLYKETGEGGLAKGHQLSSGIPV